MHLLDLSEGMHMLYTRFTFALTATDCSTFCCHQTRKSMVQWCSSGSGPPQSSFDSAGMRWGGSTREVYRVGDCHVRSILSPVIVGVFVCLFGNPLVMTSSPEIKGKLPEEVIGECAHT